MPKRKGRPFDNLQWLCNWVEAQCDGEWEHGYAFNIRMWDNPGWRVIAYLEGTYLENIAFKRVKQGYPDEDRWLDCRVENSVFMGDGDIRKLERIIGIFRRWAEANRETLRVAPPGSGRSGVASRSPREVKSGAPRRSAKAKRRSS